MRSSSSRLKMLATGMLALATCTGASADIKVGFVTSLSGPISSIGIPYAKGIEAAAAYKSQVGNHRVVLVQLDDVSDPSTSTRNARKLIDDEKVDIIIGTAGAPHSNAVAGVAREGKTPHIAVAPINVPGTEGEWSVTVTPDTTLMTSVLVDRMKRDGVKSLGYIGFSDTWGDLNQRALSALSPLAGIALIGDERYARTDTSVSGQVIKLLAKRPDAMMTGGSGTPGSLPYLAMAERGYRGRLYGNAALVNPDFVRLAAGSADGMYVPIGPVIVAEDLPESNPVRKVALEFKAAYQRVHGQPSKDPFSAYSFDAWLVLLDAAQRALGKAAPGTPEFRQALRDAIVSTKELVGAQGVYNFRADSRYGQDRRSTVLVKLEKGQWKLVP